MVAAAVTASFGSAYAGCLDIMARGLVLLYMNALTMKPMALQAIGSIGLIIDNIDWNDLSEILKIAESTKLTIYDSTYIYLARKIGCKLLTADIEVKNKGGSVTEIITFNDF